MLKRFIVAIAFLGFLGAVTLPSYTIAQTTTTTDDTKDAKAKKKTTKKKDEKADAEKKDDTKKKAEKKEKKKLTPAQQKFSDCAKSWGDHKKQTGEKTRKQYNAYMSKCIKKES